MKKVILFICLLFTVTCVYSQEHLKFKDIPIDGKLSTFVKKLKEQGYTQTDKEEYYYSLKGKFAGEDVNITPYGTEITKTVWKVMVTINNNEWSTLLDKYFDFKNLYKAKYGNPVAEFELFHNPNLIGSDEKLKAIKNDEAVFGSFFEVLNGHISVKIEAVESYGFMFGYLVITYEDAINVELFESESLSNKLDDI